MFADPASVGGLQVLAMLSGQMLVGNLMIPFRIVLTAFPNGSECGATVRYSVPVAPACRPPEVAFERPTTRQLSSAPKAALGAA